MLLHMVCVQKGNNSSNKLGATYYDSNDMLQIILREKYLIFVGLYLLIHLFWSTKTSKNRNKWLITVSKK